MRVHPSCWEIKLYGDILILDLPLLRGCQCLSVTTAAFCKWSAADFSSSKHWIHFAAPLCL